MSSGPRYYHHDVFLSHNQKDGSRALYDQLVAARVAAWHDGDADMSNQDVLQIVQQALRNSRFVCVCVGKEFRDSEWVRAEYIQALEFQRKAACTHVIVAELTEDAAVPELLENCLRFRVYDEGIDRLATLARRANSRGGYDPAWPFATFEKMNSEVLRMRSLMNQGASDPDVSDDEILKLALAHAPNAAKLNHRVFGESFRPGPLGRIHSYVEANDEARLRLCASVLAAIVANEELVIKETTWHSDPKPLYADDLHRLLDSLTVLARSRSHREAATHLHRKVLDMFVRRGRMPPRAAKVYAKYHDRALRNGRWRKEFDSKRDDELRKAWKAKGVWSATGMRNYYQTYQ